MLERAECCGPEFHAIQILAQPFERFDQVPNNHVFCLFRHCYWPLSRIGHFLLLGVKRLQRSLVPRLPAGPCANLSDELEPLAVGKSSRLCATFGSQPPGTDFDHRGVASISANSAGSAPVIQTWAPSCASSPCSARAPRRIEMRDDLVEQKDRREAGHLGDQTRVREHEPDQQRLLFAGRSVGSRRCPSPHR